MDSPRLNEATFALLPSELLDIIGGFLDDIQDLSNLARINHRCYRIFNRLLYKTAVSYNHPGPTITAASSGNLGALKLAAEYGSNLDYYHVKPLTEDEIAAKSIRYRMSPRARWGAPIHFAIIYGHRDVVAWLISKGVDIEAPARLYCGCENPNDILSYHNSFRGDYDNGVMVWTPLHYAICQRQTKIAHLLLSAGSSPLCVVPPRPASWPPELKNLDDLYNSHSTRIRHRFMWCFRYSPTCSLYWGRNVSITALDTAVASGDKLLVTRLIKNIGMDPNRLRGTSENSVFQYSAVCRDASMVDHLVSLEADARLLLKVDWSYSDYTNFPIYIAFRMHHPSAALKLVECGTPIWSRKEAWDYETYTSIPTRVEKPISLLTEVLANWDRSDKRGCGLTDKCCDHDEHELAAKKEAFLKVAQRTIDEDPHNVSIDELKAILAQGLVAMFNHADFGDEDYFEYFKIIRPAVNEDGVAQFRQSTLSLLVDDEWTIFRFDQMPAVMFLLDDRWFGGPITQIDDRLMKETMSNVVQRIPWLETSGYAILEDPACFIRTLELLRVHGAWEDARDKSEGLSTAEKGPWSLAGTIVKGEKCPELSGKWRKLRPDEMDIIPSDIPLPFTSIRWESQ